MFELSLVGEFGRPTSNWYDSPMLTDAATIADLQSEWTGVIKMRDRMQKVVTFSFVAGSIPSSATGVVYNLPVLLAFDVLGQVLRAARGEGLFACNSDHPGPLMDCAKTAFSWLDWDELRAGIRRRNEIAHDGQLFDGAQCLKDIANVEKQLMEWGLIVPR
jgi:hypothetical protein